MKRKTIIIILAICIVCIATGMLLLAPFRRFCVMRMGYFPVAEIVESDGFVPTEESNTFTKTVSGKQITLSFNTASELCLKNEYTFSIKNSWRNTNGDLYLQESILEDILQKEIVLKNYIFFSLEDKTICWQDQPKLVAHAGGGFRCSTENGYYTNSLEALIQNYSLGHRVFEFDFVPTSDGNLALVHDWTQFGNKDGVAFSSEEWKNFQTFGAPHTDLRYTSMLVGDLFDEMLVNKDIFFVTDGKITEPEEAKKEFQVLCNEAIKRDPSLLDRVIPQVYNNEMYEAVMEVYSFKNVIYTTYATPASSKEIIDFCIDYPNIVVVTANHADKRFDRAAISRIHENGMLFYVHTVNYYSDITGTRPRGVDGFYTDLLLPQDLAVYEQFS